MIWGMIYVACVVTFGQTLRFAQRRGSGILAVTAANYAAAAVVSWAVFAAFGRTSTLNGTSLAMGLGNGTMYFLHILVVLKSYQLVGIGVTSAILGTSIVVPVVSSWAAWGDEMSPFRWAALALLPLAMALLRPPAQPLSGRSRRFDLAADLNLFLVFAMAGTIATIHKAVGVYGPKNAGPAYQAVLFSTAAVVSVGYALRKRMRFTRRTVAYGAAVGGVNSMATLFLLLSLAVIPATRFFPVANPAVIVLHTLVAWTLWRETPTRRQRLGLLVALGVVALGNF